MLRVNVVAPLYNFPSSLKVVITPLRNSTSPAGRGLLCRQNLFIFILFYYQFWLLCIN